MTRRGKFGRRDRGRRTDTRSTRGEHGGAQSNASSGRQHAAAPEPAAASSRDRKHVKGIRGKHADQLGSSRTGERADARSQWKPDAGNPRASGSRSARSAEGRSPWKAGGAGHLRGGASRSGERARKRAGGASGK